MSHRLAHAWFDVGRDILWRTATDDIPALAEALGRTREAMA